MSITYTNQTVLIEEFPEKQWLQFHHLKQNHQFQVTLDSHNLGNIPDTDDVLKLCSEVLFQEYTQNSSHKPDLDGRHKSQPH